MARLPALIDDLAKHDPRGRATVEHVARVVREAGLIQTTKRGRGAADMTVSDAAALLIGLCCTEVPKDAPDAVREFKEMEPTKLFSRRHYFPREFASVMGAQTFGLALEQLILSTATLEEQGRELSRRTTHRMRPGSLSRPPSPISRTRDHYLWAEVRFFTPLASASVKVSFQKTAGSPNLGHLINYLPNNVVKSAGQFEPTFDREVLVTVELNTLARIRRLLDGS
ncbi:MAG TPA: hypothetical protein VHZ26_02130 [Caulobacteraceae bacterium]|jgi:hypothetical protein|nr:hypothetical protein [Caulobacteraceae bacterium]